MKRKKPAAVPVVQAEQTALAGQKAWMPDMVWICLFSALLFFSMIIQTGRMSMILLVLALVLSVGKAPLRNLRQRFCVPVLGFILFAFVQGFAAIYSPFGDYAIREYQKFLAAFGLAVILLVRIEKKHIRSILWGIAGICAVISFICIDMASFGAVFEAFNSFAELLGATFSTVELNTWGTRVAGIYNDANVSGSILALGSLVALYLMNSERALRKRALAGFFLGVSAQGFFLSMSRGAILCFALALLVWLLAAGKGERLPLFLLMLISAIVTVGLSVVSMTAIGVESLLPDVLTLLSGGVIFLLDWALNVRLADFLGRHSKLAVMVVLILVAGCGAYVAAAAHVTGEYTFDSFGMMSRQVKLPAGEYTVSGDWDGEHPMYVYLQTETDSLLGTRELLYKGSLEEASFTVPETDGILTVRIDGEEGDTLRSVVFSNGTELKLNYPLAPRFVVNRLQSSLLSSNSFLLRVQFMKDAVKIFAGSPLIGHGLGSTEGLYTSVQPFFYESLYVHNHILQVLCDMGLLGALPFLAMLLGGLWLLLGQLRKERGGLAALLLACWVMMNTHGLMEINFSIRAYQCLAFVLLLLPAVLYGEPLSARAAKVGGIISACLLWVYLVVFGGLYFSHRQVVRDMEKGFKTSDAGEFMSYCSSLISRDVFDHESNQLTYVANAVVLNDSDYNGNMRKYVKELRASGTYTACSGLARYYYLPKGELEELFACSREGIAQEASAKDAWNLQIEFYRNEVLPAAEEKMDVFLDGVLALRDYLEEYSQGRLEEIELTEENQAFLDAVASVEENHLGNEEAYFLLTQVMGYGQEDTES